MNSWAKVAVPPIADRFEIPTLNIFDTAKGAIHPVTKKSKYRIYVCGITPYDDGGMEMPPDVSTGG
jgi:L-cysteine:1D-myo-inositol 2-amino-2-deoxy-alpha-D-glucopyranoside ligase